VNTYPAVQLLTDRQGYWDRISDSKSVGELIGSLALFIILSSAAYGAVLGCWRSWLLAFYVAIKMPALMLGTASLVMLLNYMICAALGGGLRFKQVVAITYGAMATACWILLALSPIALFFTLTAVSQEGTSLQRDMAHNCMLLTHISLIAGAGIAGNSALVQGLRSIVAPGCSVRALYWSWVFAFAFVGCQLSWIMRPFVGSVHYEVAFYRDDALQRNFYEFVFLEVIPNLIERTFG